VTRQRLQSMPIMSTACCWNGLKEKRATTRFFVFADTVKAPYKAVDDSHGWLGIRFKPGPGPSRPKSSSMSACWTKKTPAAGSAWIIASI